MNVIHVFRDGPAWVAKIGHPADGVMSWADAPARAFLGLATRLTGVWHPFDHTIIPDALPGHERHGNAALVWRAGGAPDLAASGIWYAHLGPDSTGSGLVATGANPGSAVFALAQRVLQSGWRFDPEWRPE